MKRKFFPNDDNQLSITNSDEQMLKLKSENAYLRNIILQQSERIDKLDFEFNNINRSYSEIQNSFYWKATKPFRSITHSLKSHLSKHPLILKFFIFIKGFLRGGIKEGKKKVADYKKFVGISKSKTKKFSHKISLKTKKTEQNTSFDQTIKFSILVPLYNTPIKFLKEMINSVRNQTYENWELCLADGSDNKHSFVQKYCLKIAGRDKRVVYKKLTENKGISENTNECINMSSGDYIALFDHDDVLHPSALYECMKVICEQNADFVYTDEAVFLGTDITNIISFHFKPNFAFDNLLANNYICHFSVFKASLIDEVGAFRHSYDGSQDHDIILRLTNAAKNVVHIPKILYFWRSHSNSVAMDINSKAYAITAGRAAVHDFLATKGFNTTVESSPAYPTIYRIKYEIIGNPKISIVIPNKNNSSQFQKCISSVLTKSTYNNYEILVVDNNSTDYSLLNFYEQLSKDYRNVKIFEYDESFNYSAIVNAAVKHCEGDYILLLDSDTEIITPEWIEELLMYAQRKDVGAVGAKLLMFDGAVQHGGIILGLGSRHIVANSHYGIDKQSFGYMGKLFYAQNVSAVTSACLMVKKENFKAVDGFDENLTIAYGDVDFCLKLREKNLSNIFNPFCVLYHSENNSFYDEKIFEDEIKIFKDKWNNTLLKGDPYYNPNFSLEDSYKIQ